MKNSVQEKRASSSTLTEANIFAHPPQNNSRPVCMSQMSSVFTSLPPVFGSAQAFLLRLAQIEAQLVLNIISNIAAVNNTGYGNPLIPLLQPIGIQRSSFLSMNQPPGGFTCSHLLHRRNVDSVPQRVSPPSSSANAGIGNKKNNDPLEESLHRSSANHHGKHFTIKSVDCSRYQSMTAKAMMLPDRPQIKGTEKTENVIDALASLGLSLEDLELLSHFPDSQLTTENLPLIIQDIQQRKAAKNSKDDQAISNSSNQAESSFTNGEHYDQSRIRHSEWQRSVLTNPHGQSCGTHSYRSLRTERSSPSELIHKNFPTHPRAMRRIRDSSGRGSFSSHKRLHHGPVEVIRRRPGSVCFPSRSKCSLRRSFVSQDCDKTSHFASKTSSLHRSTSSKAIRKFPVKSGITESMNFQIPVTAMTAKTSTQTKCVIRVSGIPLDYSESELLKMSSPFGDPVEVLMAAEVDMTTGLEWKKALLKFPSELSAQEMVKVYSAIPVHMRQQSLELVPQAVDFSSSVSVFQAFVGPSVSNGLLTPLDHLLVVSNVPNQPSAATGVLRLLKPFGQVFRTLVFIGRKVDVDQCPEQSSVQMVLEMESASIASSVYEWSQKIPCLYHNHQLYFLRGCNIKKNTSEVTSA